MRYRTIYLAGKRNKIGLQTDRLHNMLNDEVVMREEVTECLWNREQRFHFAYY